MILEVGTAYRLRGRRWAVPTLRKPQPRPVPADSEVIAKLADLGGPGDDAERGAFYIPFFRFGIELGTAWPPPRESTYPRERSESYSIASRYLPDLDAAA